jgi:hypothetical protein
MTFCTLDVLLIHKQAASQSSHRALNSPFALQDCSLHHLFLTQIQVLNMTHAEQGGLSNIESKILESASRRLNHGVFKCEVDFDSLYFHTIDDHP